VYIKNIAIHANTIAEVCSWMTANLLMLNPSKTDFLLIGLPKQLSKLKNPTVNVTSDVTCFQARNLDVLFDCNLSLSGHISFITRSCFSHIRDLRRIRPGLNQTTARNIATDLVHSKLDYCNSLFLNLPANQLDRLQLVLNSAARAVTKTPRLHHITHIHKAPHWLKISQSIHNKILPITYKCTISNKPTYLRNVLAIRTTSTTRSSSVIALKRPHNPSRLKITNKSFCHSAPVLWNALPKELRLYNSAHLGNRSTSNVLLSPLCFTKCLNPISFVILILHSLSAI
jgi:hypothetical protein